jgi:hypothetical protein
MRALTRRQILHKYGSFDEKQTDAIFRAMDEWRDQFAARYIGDRTLPTYSDPIDLIKKVMQEEGIRTSELSRTIEIDQAYVYRIIEYKKMISRPMIHKVAALFRISVDVLSEPYELKPKP